MKKRMLTLFCSLLLLLLGAAGVAAETVFVPVSENNEVPVISYYVSRHIENPGLVYQKASVVLSIWANGTIVWSKNQWGGPPYYKAKLPAMELASILRYFDERGYFNPPYNRTQYAAFQDNTPTLWVLNGSRFLYMKNSHVLWEKNYKDVKGTCRGIRSLRTDDPNNIEALRTPDYMKFRRTWDEIAAYLLARVPQEGTETAAAFQEKKVILQK